MQSVRVEWRPPKTEIHINLQKRTKRQISKNSHKHIDCCAIRGAHCMTRAIAIHVINGL